MNNTKLIRFTVIRYIVFFINFIRGILMAKNMSPEFYGIWGILLLILEYLSYSNLGIHYALNNYLSLEKNELIRRKYLGSSFFVSFIVSVLLLFTAFVLHQSSLEFNTGFNLRLYYLPIAIIAASVCFKQVYLTLFRQIGRLNLINTSEVIMALLLLMAVFYGKDDTLITTMLYTTLVGNLISIGLFYRANKIKTEIKPHSPEIQALFRLGFPFLAANLFFYGMLLVTRSGIGAYYTKSDMGYFTFSANMSLACFLGINSLLWAIYPKLLSQTGAGISNEEVIESVAKINKLAVGASAVVVLLVVLLEPILFHFLPAYKVAAPVLNVMLLCQLILMFSVGESSSLTATKKRISLIKSSLIGLASVIVISFFAVKIGLPYYSILIALMIGYIIYNYMLYAQFNASIETTKITLIILLNKISPIFIIACIIVCAAMFTHERLLTWCGLIVLFLGLRKNIYFTIKYGLKQYYERA